MKRFLFWRLTKKASIGTTDSVDGFNFLNLKFWNQTLRLWDSEFDYVNMKVYLRLEYLRELYDLKIFYDQKLKNYKQNSEHFGIQSLESSKHVAFEPTTTGNSHLSNKNDLWGSLNVHIVNFTTCESQARLQSYAEV